MSHQVALYGFIRRKEGLRIRPQGVEKAKCTLLYTGRDTAAVISLIKDKHFKPNAQDLVRHEEAVTSIFDKQVILPAKFPKIITIRALEKSMTDMEKDLAKVLRRIIYKNEYHVRIFMTEPSAEETPVVHWNAFSKFVLENAERYKYRHYFPLLTREAKQAEFVDYAESVVRHITQKICCHTTYWRGRSFHSEKVLLESYFWVRKHKSRPFEKNVEELKEHYPNLRFCALGPTPPYNFVQLDFAES